MSTDRETTRAVRSWLDAGVTRLPDRVLDAVLDQVPATPQRRSPWAAWRPKHVNTYAKWIAAAAAVLVVAIVGYQFLPGVSGPGGPTTAPSAVTTPAPTAAPSAVTATTVTIMPFGPGGFGMCPNVVGTDCVEDPRDDGMTFTLDLPPGWELQEATWVQPRGAPLSSGSGGTGLLITRGNWLYGEPCRPDEAVNPDVPVGPSADDLVLALEAHTLLDVSVAFIKEIGGHTGTYLEIQLPSDISNCVEYRPMDQTIYAQGPNQLWRLWIVDVNGIRVVVQGFEYPSTSQQHRDELQAVVDSIRITP